MKLSCFRPTFMPVCLLCLLFCVSCENAEAWYPAGDVSIEDVEEYLDSGGNKIANLVLKVDNVGLSSINTSFVSIQFSTDARSYFETHVAEIMIQPGRSIWLNISVMYNSPTEQYLADSALISDVYFK